MELDLGDMLAALEKQQQAMKARQLNNTKPLSLTGTQHHSWCVGLIWTSCDINHVKNKLFLEKTVHLDTIDIKCNRKMHVIRQQ